MDRNVEYYGDFDSCRSGISSAINWMTNPNNREKKTPQMNLHYGIFF